MAPVKLSLDIKQGDTFHEEWGWTDSVGAPVPLAGCTALMQLRAWVGAGVALELSTENGRIALSDGLIVLDVPATDMQALTLSSGVFDLQIEYADGRVATLATGRFQVSPDIAIRGQ